MQPIRDYQTLLQLAVGLNLVLGGYGKFRLDLEDGIKQDLTEARKQVDELIRGNKDNTPIDKGIEKQSVKLLNDRELSRYLSDVTIRFYRRSNKSRIRDSYVNLILLSIGLINLIILSYASVWPKTKIHMPVIYISIVISFGLPLGAMLLAIIERSAHELYRNRTMNSGEVKKLEESHNKRIKTEPLKGEISRVSNRVRTRYSELQNDLIRKSSNTL